MLRVNGGLLCDRHMYAANKLLARQYPHLDGLNSTLLSQSPTGFPQLELSGGYMPTCKCISKSWPYIVLLDYTLHYNLTCSGADFV